MRGGASLVRARPFVHRAGRRLEVARVPERERQQAQHRDVRRLGVAGVDQALGRQLVLAFGHRALRRDQEALDALARRVGL